jgi:hypothetical protein
METTFIPESLGIISSKLDVRVKNSNTSSRVRGKTMRVSKVGIGCWKISVVYEKPIERRRFIGCVVAWGRGWTYGIIQNMPGTKSLRQETIAQPFGTARGNLRWDRISGLSCRSDGIIADFNKFIEGKSKIH